MEVSVGNGSSLDDNSGVIDSVITTKENDTGTNEKEELSNGDIDEINNAEINGEEKLHDNLGEANSKISAMERKDTIFNAERKNQITLEPSLTRLLPLLQSTKRLLIIGPILLDEYAHGTCQRMAPESGAPVFSNLEYVEYFLGGAANVANNAAALGMNVDMLAVIGEGDNDVMGLMNEKGIGTEGIVVCPKYTVSRKRRFIAKGRHLMRLDRDNEYELTEADHESLLQTLKCMLHEHTYNVITISDYINGLSEGFIKKVLTLVNARNIPTVVDPCRTDSYSKFIGCTYIKPNLEEARKFCNREIKSNESIHDACVEFTEKIHARGCFLTLAERGIAIYSKNNEGSTTYDMISNPKSASPPVDVCGAGDTALAAIAFGLANALPLHVVGQFATICATNVIRKVGTAVVEMLEIIPEKVLFSKQDLLTLKRFLPKDKTVVLTTGYFDQIHYGYIGSLRQAKELGDILIVALNSDSSTVKNKGDSQPVWKMSERIGMLLATKYVDFVVVFDESKPIWVIETLDPDFFVKGDKYSEDDLRFTLSTLRKVRITKSMPENLVS